MLQASDCDLSLKEVGMTAIKLILTIAGKTTEHEFEKELISVASSPEADIVIPEIEEGKAISLTFLYQGDSWALITENPHNQLLLNGKSFDSSNLEVKDLISIGPHSLMVAELSSLPIEAEIDEIEPKDEPEGEPEDELGISEDLQEAFKEVLEEGEKTPEQDSSAAEEDDDDEAIDDILSELEASGQLLADTNTLDDKEREEVEEEFQIDDILSELEASGQLLDDEELNNEDLSNEEENLEALTEESLAEIDQDPKLQQLSESFYEKSHLLAEGFIQLEDFSNEVLEEVDEISHSFLTEQLKAEDKEELKEEEEEEEEEGDAESEIEDELDEELRELAEIFDQEIDIKLVIDDSTLASIDIEDLIEQADELDPNIFEAEEEVDKFELEFADSDDVAPLALEEEDAKEETEDEEEDEYADTPEVDNDEFAEDKEKLLIAGQYELKGDDIYDENAEPLYIDEEVELSIRTDLRELVSKIMPSLVAILVLSFTSAIATYAYFLHQYDKEEIVAARQVSDISMALAHAMLSPNPPEERSKLQQDKESFFLEHISAVLPSEYQKNILLDNLGRIEGTSYYLDILTDYGLNHFLIFAHPEEGYFQSLFTRRTLTVDSSTMTLRKIIDGQPWRALIANENSLDRISGSEITALIIQEKLLALKKLDDENKQLAFTPPKELMESKPGAESFIYNAPRYYLFGQELLQKASQLGLGIGAEEDIEELAQQSRKFKVFNDLVLYSARGMPSAIQAYTGFNSHPSLAAYLLAYLSFDKASGKIASAQLLPSDLASESPEEIDATIKQFIGKKLETKQADIKNDKLGNSSSYYDLKKVLEKRHISLKKVSQEITELLEENNEKPLSNFFERYTKLDQKHQELSEEYRQALVEQLENSFTKEVQKEDSLSSDDFLQLISRLELEPFVSSKLSRAIKGEANIEAINKLNISEILANIIKTSSLKELDVYVEQAKSLLNSENVSSPTKLTQIRNKLRSAVLEKVGDFVLSPASNSLPELLQQKNRLTIEKILRNAQVSEEDEREFYLSEFDSLMEQYHSVLNTSDLDKLQHAQDKLTVFVDYDKTLTSNEKEKLKENFEHRNKSIEKGKLSAKQLKDRITLIPVGSLYADDKLEHEQNLGRLGQQILIQESLQPPGNERDEQLTKAISLLMQSTEQNRALWGDILEARKLISQSSEKKISSIFEEKVGFQSSDKSLLHNIKEKIQHYINSKRQLANIHDEDQYLAQLELFQETQLPLLKEVVENSRKVESLSKTLAKGSKNYIKQLEEFFEDYQHARNQGFFVSDNHYHTLMTSRLAYKIALAKNFHALSQELSKHLAKNSKKSLSIALREIDNLSSNSKISSQEISQLQSINNQISFPDLSSTDLPDNFKKVLDINVNPTP